MKYFYFSDNENTKTIDLNKLKEIELSSSFENYFDLKKSIFFNELRYIYTEDILLKLENFYETLNAANDEEIKEIKTSADEILAEIDNYKKAYNL